MENKKVRIVCIGIGGYAQVYWKSLFADKSDDFEIVGGVDPYPEAAKFYPDIVADRRASCRERVYWPV